MNKSPQHNDIPWKSKTLVSIELSETCTSPNGSAVNVFFQTNHQ